MKKDRVRIGTAFWAACFSLLAVLSVPAAQAAYPEGLSLEGQDLTGLTLEEAGKKAEEWDRCQFGRAGAGIDFM